MSTPVSLALLGRGMQVAALNTVIALVLTAFGEHDFASNLVYAQCIGLSIWSLIDFGRLWLIRDPIKQWRRLFWIVPLSVSLSFVLGTLAAGAVLNDASFSYWADQPRKALGLLIVSLFAGVGSTYYFLSREQLERVHDDMANASAQTEAAQRQATESRLKLLQTQLEPHMLFNTLANLRALIGTDPQRAQQMLDHMIAYLRATLSASRTPMHTLQAEFDRLRDYLELMAVRMGPRLSYTLDLPADLAQHPVPTLLLQPLVENAIKHGLEPKVEGGSITVRARHEAGWITLEVLDTGVGPAHGSATGDGFGLAQVRERLATTYGNQDAIELVASHTGGTRASITFPCNT